MGIVLLVAAAFSAGWYFGLLAMVGVVIVIFLLYRLVRRLVAAEKPRPKEKRWHELSRRERVATAVLFPVIAFLWGFGLGTARTYRLEEEPLGYSLQIGAICGGLLAVIVLGAVASTVITERHDEPAHQERFWKAYEERTGRGRPGNHG